jgi:DNA-binding CsgD family transcriptional regulator
VKPHGGDSPRRIAVVAADPDVRRGLLARAGEVAGLDVVAWADDVGPLLVLGSRVDACPCTEPPDREAAARLTERGAAVVVVPPGADTADLHRALAQLRTRDAAGRAAPRPQLSRRQHEVLVAYATGSDLLPTVARRLGMNPETLKTHLRRIRAKYAQVGRPAPTRRDLYVRAVEDGLVPPPAESGPSASD